MKDDIKKECELLAICNQTKYNEEKKEEAISMARTANVFARVEPEVKRTGRAGAGSTWNSNVQCSRNVSETDCAPERNSF